MPKRRSAHHLPDPAEPDSSITGAQGREADQPATLAGPSLPGDIPGTSPATPKRAGTDARHRGWYWHWNGIVTQYAPLIGLKGVGLLNSYTVWTDRREQSATRGYAFPSQQSEGDFYGEDRSELITINKILVTLDLIEIRKEMVLRTDPQGRKWKVPHNLYRVKDRPDGIELRTDDVLRVAELASRDAAVFRYLKRIFSPRFSPIDRDNVWHQILAEVASDPTWQALTDKTSKIEARASARTRAGHKARTRLDTSPEEADAHSESSSMTDGNNDSNKETDAALMTTGHSSTEMLQDGEQETQDPPEPRTSVGGSNHGSGCQMSDVAGSNTGLATNVDSINTGLEAGDESSADATNTGPASVVAPSNATYHQDIPTTTTTTTGAKTDDCNTDAHPTRAEHDTPASADLDQPLAATQHETGRVAGAGQAGLDNSSPALPADERSGSRAESLTTTERSLADPGAGGPLVDPGALVVSLFEAANDRRASPLERMLLAELERDADPVARTRNESGSDWVAAALREAVASGSAFVAPKRVREIINRWAATGNRPQLETPRSPQAETGDVGTEPIDSTQAIRLPSRRNPERVWQAVLDDLGRVLDTYSHQRLFNGSRIVGYHRGTVVLQVSADSTDKLSAEYRPLLERHLGHHIGRAVTVQFVATNSSSVELPSATPPADPIAISASDAEQGRQLWRAVLSELAPAVSADDLARLRGALPLGQDGEGHIVIGAPTALAARLIDSRCRTAVEAALQALLGDSVAVRVARGDEWSIIDERSEG